MGYLLNRYWNIHLESIEKEDYDLMKKIVLDLSKNGFLKPRIKSEIVRKLK